MTSIPKPKTPRDKKYLAFIRKQPCCLCGAKAEPHHISSIAGTGMGMKPSDYYTIPLCRPCHSKVHDYGELRILDGIDIKRLKIDYLSRYIQEEIK